MKALRPLLGEDYADFSKRFWEVSEITSETFFEVALNQLLLTYECAKPYVSTLFLSKEKWAYAYTHQHFLAGISSTQRQESINFVVKNELIKNGEMSNILDAFDRIDERVMEKALKERIRDDLYGVQAPDILSNVASSLTPYIRRLVSAEAILADDYNVSVGTVVDSLKISHKDHPNKHRLVFIGNPEDLHCSCKQRIWKGYPCRHIFRAMKQLDVRSTPITMFSLRWQSDFDGYAIPASSSVPIVPLPPISAPPSASKVYSDLMSECKYICMVASENSDARELVGSGIKDIQDKLSDLLRSQDGLENVSGLEIVNPLRINPRGRPSRKRLIGLRPRSKAKRATVRCSSCQQTGHNLSCLLYTSPSPRDRTRPRMPSSA